MSVLAFHLKPEAYEDICITLYKLGTYPEKQNDSYNVLPLIRIYRTIHFLKLKVYVLKKKMSVHTFSDSRIFKIIHFIPDIAHF